MKYYYIGGFPPPYGGVTIKNRILYNNLMNNLNMRDIEKIDLIKIKNKNIIEILKFLYVLLNPYKVFIIGASGRPRRILSKLLYYLNRKSLRKSLVILMGGIATKEIKEDRNYIKWLSEYKQVYVETVSMKKDLLEVGLNNITVFPNCREKPNIKLNIVEKKSRQIKCLFFSLISKEKGADIVIEASKILKKRNIDFKIDFYGQIADEYSQEFKRAIKDNENVKYFGVSKLSGDKLYTFLNEYDVLLLPTRWKAEGVPGVLVESKISCLPAIVSDINYNSEIIQNGENGIVLKENNPEYLSNAIIYLYKNEDILKKYKINSKISSEKYLIENYIHGILKMIE